LRLHRQRTYQAIGSSSQHSPQTRKSRGGQKENAWVILTITDTAITDPTDPTDTDGEGEEVCEHAHAAGAEAGEVVFF
jgi:hypothetical protein